MYFSILLCITSIQIRNIYISIQINNIYIYIYNQPTQIVFSYQNYSTIHFNWLFIINVYFTVQWFLCVLQTLMWVNNSGPIHTCCILPTNQPTHMTWGHRCQQEPSHCWNTMLQQYEEVFVGTNCCNRKKPLLAHIDLRENHNNDLKHHCCLCCSVLINCTLLFQFKMYATLHFKLKVKIQKIDSIHDRDNILQKKNKVQ